MILFKEKNYPVDLIKYVKNIFSIRFKIKIANSIKKIEKSHDPLIIFENFCSFKIFKRINDIKNIKILILTEYFDKCKNTNFKTLNLEKDLSYYDVYLVSSLFFLKKYNLFRYKFIIFLVLMILLIFNNQFILLSFLMTLVIIHKVFQPFENIIRNYNLLVNNKVRHECILTAIKNFDYIVYLSEDIYLSLKKTHKQLLKKNNIKFLFLDLFSQIQIINIKKYQSKLKKISYGGQINTYRKTILKSNFADYKPGQQNNKFLKSNKKNLFQIWVPKYRSQNYSPGSIINIINQNKIPLIYPTTAEYYLSFDSSSQINKIINNKFNFNDFKKKINFLKKKAKNNNKKKIYQLLINENK